MITWYAAGEQFTVTLPNETQGEPFRGLGVRARSLESGAVWRLRPVNSSFGYSTYHPHPKFEVGGVTYDLSPGDNTLVEYRPADAPSVIRFTFAEPTSMKIVYEGAEPVGEGEENTATSPPGLSGLWLSSDWRTMNEASLLDDLGAAVRLGGFTHRLLDEGWYTEDSPVLLTPRDDDRMSALRVVEAYRSAGIPVVLWMPSWVRYGTVLWDACDSKGWFVKTGEGKSYVFPVKGDGDVYGSYLDFSNNEVVARWRGRLAKLLDLGGVTVSGAAGVAGWKLDFGENLPDDAVMLGEILLPDVKPGKCGFSDYASAATAGVGQSGVVVRSGWRHTPTVAGLWTGDHDATMGRFNGLMSAVHCLRTAHNIGYTETGFDIGGYFGTPTELEMLGWQGLAAASSFGVYHGLGERHPARYPSSVQSMHVKVAAVRTLIRETDPSFYSYGEWFTGVVDDEHAGGVMVAQRNTEKVIVGVGAGRDQTPVLFPEGRWMNPVTGSVFEGSGNMLGDAAAYSHTHQKHRGHGKHGKRGRLITVEGADALLPVFLNIR